MWFNRTSNNEYNQIFFRLVEIPDFKLLEMRRCYILRIKIINAILKSRGNGDENGRD